MVSGTSEHFTEMQMSSKCIPVQQLDVAHGALHQGFRGDAAVLGPQLLFQRAAVDADADGDVPAGGRLPPRHCTRSSPPMLPGLMRMASIPRSAHISASW